MKPTSLIEALQDTDMLEIDGLYAWQFDLDTELLAQISAGTAGRSIASMVASVACGRSPWRRCRARATAKRTTAG
jgi:hypothetical protein